MKWGTKFSPEYVNCLFRGVRRNITGNFRFICFTEDTTGLVNGVEVQPLPELNLPSHLPERGWRKLTLFQERLADLTGPVLFLDLDVVIAESLDPFFEVPGEFRIIRDWNLQGKNIGNSSVFRFEVGRHTDILSDFLAKGEEIRARVRNEQAYLSECMLRKGLLKYWDDSWCLSFKKHYMRRFPLGYFVQPKRRPGTKIIVFHGNPNPDAVLYGWHSGSFLRAVRPTPWLAELWNAEK